MVTIFIITSWILASLVEGCRDGFYYHNSMTSTSPAKQNIHFLFTIERTIIGLAHTIIYLKLVDGNYYHAFTFGLSLMFIFSWFHNGMYLTTRNYLDNKEYPKKWFDDSTTSTARGEFPLEIRTLFAVIGSLLIILLQII